MRVIKNINSVNVCTLLGNKGVGSVCAALDSLTKKDEKNIANYWVSRKTQLQAYSLKHTIS